MTKKISHIILFITLPLTLLSCTNDVLNKNISSGPIPEANVEYNYTTEELEVTDLINEYRASIGLNALEKINYVSVKSEEHNNYMISNNVVNHDDFVARSEDIIKTLGVIKVSENIAYNYKTPQAAFNAWLASPEHKKNITGDYTNFGISITKNPINGRNYYTNIFVKY
ncbi:CAP domain-containing protein [Flavobacterium sp. LS1R47]|uniref:CAP domain-containing protein n=1 Tax=Flavobacterium frigoritolerans TaxID=2987686 RepID=A0A9X3HMI3_9FLAO|nr:CAP domain-containing protein [Flavobacterium frigoritolerans]MCV9933939.1 CAP domain-containing protein [Flavobacterium frigoritolerans]